MSNTAFASHFKGGYLTYSYLGAGKYEFLITGYWDKDEVGSIVPRYQGYPAIDNSPVTVSKTLLQDGETVEHVQKQLVTWSKPGLYTVYWRNCCRAVGSNFGNNIMGLFAAVNYNPDAPSSSPQFNDDRLFNFVSNQRIIYTINMEDPEGHEQEFSLETPYGLPADVYEEMLESGFNIKKDGTMFWKNPIAGEWLVNIRLREKVNGAYTGAYIDREIIIHVNSVGNGAGNEHAQGGKKENAGRNAKLQGNVAAENLTLEPIITTAEVVIYPHPLTDVSKLKVILKEADVITVDIIDLSGKVVKELYAGSIEANQELSFEINSKFGNKNFYIARLTTTKGVHSFKLIVQ